MLPLKICFTVEILPQNQESGGHLELFRVLIHLKDNSIQVKIEPDEKQQIF